eukprot:CAMPEP_0119415360 /NCGR_PEP_ID=MMETSP1335-20130426/8881_1 /TAXON_ID=259385 /ORGANISM="Chrysoculter rhomboideus, Strain RCC1486" /LENGTH=103 /DNA_ID=CAMNT_0007440351 /DNA_START=117 /DNA_END=428 /DNA_ORIENTATION=+
MGARTVTVRTRQSGSATAQGDRAGAATIASVARDTVGTVGLGAASRRRASLLDGDGARALCARLRWLIGCTRRMRDARCLEGATPPAQNMDTQLSRPRQRSTR